MRALYRWQTACLLPVLVGCTSADPAAPLDLAAARELSVALASCTPRGTLSAPAALGYVGAYNVELDDVRWIGGPGSSDLERQRAHCASAAGGDCAAIQRCYDLAVVAVACGPDYDSQCTGSASLSTCLPPGFSVTSPCGPGTHCITMSATQSTCALDTCVGADGPRTTCASEAQATTCLGGILYPSACLPGEACVDGLGCMPTGVACSTDTCEGDVAVACEEAAGGGSSRGATAECGALGMRCTLQGTRASCVATADTCSDGAWTCADANVLRACDANGEFWDYDCTAHGFAGCQASSTHPGEAFCRPAQGPGWRD